MVERKACLVFTSARAADAERVAQRLQDEGFAVCSAEATIEEAQSIKAGEATSLPEHIADCIANAEVCVLVVDEDHAGAFGGLGGLASDCGSRVVTVGGEPSELPPELDDIIDGHLATPESPQFDEVVCGRADRVEGNDSPSPKRDEDRVKCQ